MNECTTCYYLACFGYFKGVGGGRAIPSCKQSISAHWLPFAADDLERYKLGVFDILNVILIANVFQYLTSHTFAVPALTTTKNETGERETSI